MSFKSGDLVEVRSKDEILATLDAEGKLEALPFMPQMFNFCGQRYRVFRRAHKTCDTINKTGGRRMDASVHLEDLRCDGNAYGGCDAGCLIFWKEAWLKPAESRHEPKLALSSKCTEDQVWSGVRGKRGDGGENQTYTCQATELFKATKPISSCESKQYWEDYRSGNVRLGRLMATGCYVLCEWLINRGIGLGQPLRCAWDMFSKLGFCCPYPNRRGRLQTGQLTPVKALDLQPGEWVRVKDYSDILGTLDGSNKNRGLYFDREEVPYCGGTYKVLKRVQKIIDEKTGKMILMKTPSVILENVYCQGRYSDRRLFCPRAIFPMWREIWLERLNKDTAEVPQNQHEIRQANS